MIIIGSSLAFALFIIGLHYYDIIFGGILFLCLTIYPLIFIVSALLQLYLKYKDYKKGKIPSFSKYNCVYAIIEIGFGIWFLIDITIPFFQSL